MQLLLKLRQHFPQTADNKVFKRPPSKKFQQFIRNFLEVVLHMSLMLTDVVALIDWHWESELAWNRVREFADYIELIKVKRKPASIVFIGETDDIAVDLVENFIEWPENKLVVEKGSVSYRPR